MTSQDFLEGMEAVRLRCSVAETLTLTPEGMQSRHNPLQWTADLSHEAEAPSKLLKSHQRLRLRESLHLEGGGGP